MTNPWGLCLSRAAIRGVSRGVYEGEGAPRAVIRWTLWPEGRKCLCMCALMSAMRVWVACVRHLCLCVYVCVCVPCGSRGQAEGIRLTDVTVYFYGGIQTRHIHLNYFLQRLHPGKHLNCTIKDFVSRQQLVVYTLTTIV